MPFKIHELKLRELKQLKQLNQGSQLVRRKVRVSIWVA